MVWDLDREQLASSIPTHSDSAVSAMVSSTERIAKVNSSVLLNETDSHYTSISTCSLEYLDC